MMAAGIQSTSRRRSFSITATGLTTSIIYVIITIAVADAVGDTSSDRDMCFKLLQLGLHLDIVEPVLPSSDLHQIYTQRKYCHELFSHDQDRFPSSYHQEHRYELTSKKPTVDMSTGNISAYENDNCPISSMTNPLKDFVYPYPEFFFGKIYNVTKGTGVVAADHRFLCRTKRMLPIQEIPCNNMTSGPEPCRWIEDVYSRHLNNPSECFSGLCPLVDENIQSIMKVVDWEYDIDLLCILERSKPQLQAGEMISMAAKMTVKVVVFGGSATLGRGSLGTCCAPLNTGTCDTREDGMHRDTILDKTTWYCGNWGFVMRWFVHYFPHVNIEFSNLGLGGASSGMMAFEVDSQLALANITLTQNDIVILDHSCNDRGGPAQPLEMLVRSIYHRFPDRNSAPLLMVMEQCPRHRSDFKGYREVAKHYRLPLFSHVNLVLHPTDDQRLLFELLLHSELHATWNVHMMMADEFAKWAQETIKEKCNLASGPGLTSLSSPLDSNEVTKTHSSSPLEPWPPEPLTDMRYINKFTCSASSPYILSEAPTTDFQPTNLAEFESHLTGWTAYVDKHPPAAWMVNINAPPDNQTLSFQMKGFAANSSDRIGLRILHLQTYVNAGSCHVFLCGERLGEELRALAGLNGDDRHTAVSVPHEYLYELRWRDISRCSAVDDAARRLELRLIPQDRSRNREDNKVKIFSVHMCHLQ